MPGLMHLILQTIDEKIEIALRRAGITGSTVNGGNISGPITGVTTQAHNHTSSASDGGAISGGLVDTFVEFTEQGSDPAAPTANIGRLFGKDVGGVTLPHWRDEGGDVVPLAGSAGGGAASIYTSAYGSPPSAPVAGDLWLPTNSFYLLRYSGAAWVPWGPIFPMTPPVDGDFAWINQGTATVDTSQGGILLTAPAVAGTQWRLRVKSAPATPYTITAYLLPTLLESGGVALLWRESATGEWTGVRAATTVVGASKYDSATVFNSEYASFNQGATINSSMPPWFQISDDGTNRRYRVSWDGEQFVNFATIGRTDFLTADQVGFGVTSSSASFAAYLRLLSWRES